MAAEGFTIKHGDTLPVMVFTLYQDEALTTVVDLTNAAPNGVLCKIGEGPVRTKTATVPAPTNGQGNVKFVADDWTVLRPGTYNMEFEVTWQNGDVSSYPRSGYAKLLIVPDLDV